MTCINLGSTIVCVQPYGRLHVDNKYIYLDYYSYCGPWFYTDKNHTEVYDPVDEDDPVWDEFDKWLKKYLTKQQKYAAKKLKGNK